MAQPSNQPLNEIHNAAKPGDKPESQSNSEKQSEPSGYKGDSPATAGPGETHIHSATPENALGHLNPSAPEDSNVSPGSTTVK